MDEYRLASITLAEAGFCGGDPEKVMRARADWVLKMMQYEAMKADYEDVYLKMNQEG